MTRKVAPSIPDDGMTYLLEPPYISLDTCGKMSPTNPIIPLMETTAATATLYALGAFKYLVGGNCFDTYPPNENLTNVTDYPTIIHPVYFRNNRKT